MTISNIHYQQPAQAEFCEPCAGGGGGGGAGGGGGGGGVGEVGGRSLAQDVSYQAYARVAEEHG